MAIGAVGAILAAGGLIAGLMFMGYLPSPFTSAPTVAEREASSKLNSSVRPSARELKTLVRKLTDAHDRMVRGDTEAVNLPAVLDNEIADRFQKFEPADWRDRRNYQSMMNYVLMGGRPEIVGSFLKANVATPQQRTIAKGVLAFFLGRRKTALKLIGDADPRGLDQAFAAPLSVALASLKISEDPDRGLMLFDEARLQAPETAIEEAALRREIPLLLKQSQFSRSMQLASRYVRRFGKSFYATSFYDTFSGCLASSDEANTPGALDAFFESLESVDASTRAEFYLTIGRKALMSGKMNLAKKAATAVVQIMPADSQQANRGKLIVAAADAPSDRAGSALAAIKSISDDHLDPDELQIRDAARGVAAKVLGPEFETNSTTGKSPDLTASDADAEAVGEPQNTSGVIDRVGKALKSVDGILAGGKG